MLGEDHQDTLGTLNNFGNVYADLKNNEKALECYERALEGYKETLGKNDPGTLTAMECITGLYNDGLKYCGKAEELYQRALEGYEAQLRKDNLQRAEIVRDWRSSERHTLM